MTATIDLGDVARSGAWFVSDADLETLAAEGESSGLRARRVPLAGCRGKAELLARMAAALEFPPTFGGNWDALSDCLRDLGWLAPARGTLLLFEHAVDLRDAAEPAFDALLDILEDAAVAWKARGAPFFAFLALPDVAFPAAPHAPD